MDDTIIVSAFEKLQIPLMIVGPDGKISRCNSATDHLFGFAPGHLLGRSVFDILPVTSLAELNAYITPPAIDVTVKGMIGRKKGDDPIALGAYITAWTDAERGQQHALVLRDITDELDVERLTRQELERTNNAIEGAHIGTFDYNALTDTLIISDIGKKLLEINVSETTDVDLNWHARIHPHDLDLMQKATQLCLDGSSDTAGYEYRLRRKDGSHWQWIRSDISVAQKNEEGKATRIIGTLTDISDQKATENALRVSADQFRSSFDNAMIGMAIVDTKGAWLQVNSALCDLLGYSEKELLTKDFQTLTYPEDLGGSVEALHRLVQGEIKSYQCEKRYIRADGAIIWGHLSVGMVTDAEDNPAHFIAQILDITEQRNLHEMKSEFVATISHELRTPLTSVLGSFTLLSLMDDEPFTDEARRLLFIGKTNADRLHTLVNDILDFEKFSAHEMQLIPSAQRIIGLVEESLLANLALADKFGVRFKESCLDRGLTGFFDPERFKQIMANLLSNAAKFANEGSTVDVTIEKQEKSIKVSVSNIGEGISDEFRDRIFKPFAQAQLASTRKRGGTGLGLSITKQIVEQMGGEIGFTSEKDTKTVFWFTVPMDDPNSFGRPVF